MNHMVDAIFGALAKQRLPLSQEILLQEAIAVELDRAGICYEREKSLSAADRPDFMCGRIAIEVKIKGGKRSIFRQVERYMLHDAVESLVLVTNVPMGMPALVAGKSVYVLNLAKAWL